MKKITLVVIAIICVIALLLITLPKYYGSQDKQYLQGFIEGIQHGSNGSVTGRVLSSSSGWFSSKATIELTYTPSIAQSNKDENIQPEKFDLITSTHYGPILITERHGIAFGQAYINFQLENNKNTSQYFKDPLLTGNNLIRFNGTNHIKISGLQMQNNPQIKFGGFKAFIDVNGDLTKAFGNINFDQLQFTNNDNKVIFAPFNQTFNLSRPSSSDLWSGKKVLTFPTIQIDTDTIKSTFNTVSISSNIEINKDNTNARMVLLAPNFTVNQQTGNFHAVLNMENLNSAALYKIQSTALSLENKTLTSTEIDAASQQILGEIINAFSGQSVVQFNANLSVPKIGNIILNTGYDNSKPESKMNFLVKMDNGKSRIAAFDLQSQGINKTALGRFLQFIVNANPEDVGTPAFEDQAKNLITKLFTPSSKINLKIIAPAENNSNFLLLNAKAYFNQLPENPTIGDLINKVQLHAQWKIPTYATQLMQIFAPVIISKMENKEDQSQATSVYIIFEKLLPFMIQQGYLRQQGNYYFSTWSINSQDILMNNKSVKTLVDELNKIQGLQQPSNQIAITNSENQEIPLSIIPSINSIQ